MAFTKMCENCNKQFNADNDHRQYCSVGCRGEARQTRKVIGCSYCHKEMIRQLSAIQKNSYCSKDCRIEHRKQLRLKSCEHCHQMFDSHNRNRTRFCSLVCASTANAIAGKTISRPWLGKERIDMQGEKNPNWKGDKVGYYGLHKWVQLHRGKAHQCEFCGLNEKPKGLKQYFDWANKSGKYFRDLSDWLQLCKSCHKKYDLCRS